MERYTRKQLQEICSEKNPKGVICSGKKAYLFEKLSKLGLLDKEVNEDENRASTVSYLSTLNQRDLQEAMRALPVTVKKDITVTDLASFFVNSPYYTLSSYCSHAKALCSDAFYRSLMSDVYPDIYELFLKVKIKERMKAFHDEYHPQRVGMDGTVLRGNKRVFHFWEHLYSEIL